MLRQLAAVVLGFLPAVLGATLLANQRGLLTAGSLASVTAVLLFCAVATLRYLFAFVGKGGLWLRIGLGVGVVLFAITVSVIGFTLVQGIDELLGFLTAHNNPYPYADTGTGAPLWLLALPFSFTYGLFAAWVCFLARRPALHSLERAGLALLTFTLGTFPCVALALVLRAFRT